MVGMQGNYHCISGSMSLHLPCNPSLVLLPVFVDQKAKDILFNSQVNIDKKKPNCIVPRFAWNTFFLF